MKNFVNDLLRKTTGYYLTKQPPARLNRFFEMLKEHGFKPNLIFDIGANHGGYTRTAIKFFPSAKYVLVEPQAHLKSYVQDLIDGGTEIRWITGGAGPDNCVKPFLVSHRDDSSSFVFDPDKEDKSKIRELEIKTLNEIAKSEGRVPDLVKIDAEGLDLEILDGASDLIGKTDIFLLEGSFSREYNNSSLEVIRKMNSMGYDMVDITDLNYSPKFNVLWTMEMVFLRKGSNLLEAAVSYD
jgi:FkbM family methyltransferase